MAERPILFSAPLVRAILEGRKTETRRLVTPSTSVVTPGPWAQVDDPTRLSSALRSEPRAHAIWAYDRDSADVDDCHMILPRVEPGDVLYVRENFAQTRGGEYDQSGEWTGYWTREAIHYTADGPSPKYARPNEQKGQFQGRPSIHMPKWASRIRLLVTEVRAERLQEIDEAGARAEGMEAGMAGFVFQPARARFERIWDSIYSGEQAWAADPWVWVWRFEIAEVKS